MKGENKKRAKLYCEKRNLDFHKCDKDGFFYHKGEEIYYREFCTIPPLWILNSRSYGKIIDKCFKV